MTDKKPLIFGAVALVLIVLIVAFAGKNKGPEGQPTVEGPAGGGAPAAGAPATGGSQAVGGAGGVVGGTVRPQTNATAKGITFSSPAAGAQWVIGNTYEVRWSKGIAVTGGAALVDANKAVVGWIAPAIKEFQPSFSWDGRYMILGRTNPSQIQVQPGTYTIRVTFDKGAGTIESPAFSLLAKGQGSAVQTMTIKNGYLSPTKITAKRGEKILFVNNDGAAYELWISTFIQQTIPAGGSWTFDTNPLDRTTYAISAKNQASVQGTLVIQ